MCMTTSISLPLHTASAIPAPSTTTPTIMTDPETFPLGAIMGIIVAVLAIAGVCVVIAGE